ncbi:stage III sporulation protein AG [Niallia sp. XMNu-256]|uniref:stage III sporulation protein AG n=1 Tax=Niallia sp. XMNu-256 TaxID=3082444 RepID=UPI0030D0D416
MKQEKGPLSWLKRQFSKDENAADKKKGKYPYLILVLLFGTGFMLISNLLSNDGTSKEAVPTLGRGGEEKQADVETFGQKNSEKDSLIDEYERTYESQLKEALDAIVGVDDVTVVVNVDSTETKVFEKNRNTQTQLTDETDREGGKRKVEDQSIEEQLVIIQNGEKEVPIVAETKKPEIRGVLVVAKGADNIQVKKWIVEAVTRVLDVPSHRVAVMPKKTKEE